VGAAINLDWAILGLIALRTTIIYFVLLVGIRIVGKRQVADLSPFDLVVLIVLGNAVQNAMTGEDYTLTGGIVSAVTLLAVNHAVSVAAFRSKRFRRVAEGGPVPVVIRGKMDRQAMRREHVTEDDIITALREHGTLKLEDVELVMLEVDGSVSVIRRGQ
jgi:uncharacterized membrane protein YcaP (DUF421 family)